MNTFEYVSIFFASFSVILGYAAYSQNRKANRLQENIAKLQGIYDKPQLDLLVFNRPIASNYIYAIPFNKKSVFVPLNLLLSNNGSIRAKNVELYINSPNEIIPHEIMKLKKVENSFKNTEFKILSTTAYKTTCGFQTESLEQKNSMSIQFDLALRTSTINKKGSTIFTTKDNVEAEAKYIISYLYDIKIWAYSENHSPISKEIKISVLDTSENNLKDYFKNIAIENEKQHNEKIEKLNKLQRIKISLNPKSHLRPKLLDICLITSDDFVENDANPNLTIIKSVEISFGVQGTDGFTFIPHLNMNGYPKELL